MTDQAKSPLAIEEILANAAERATMLRSEGHPVQAQSIERITSEVRAALGEFLTWVSEPDAITYTGRSVEYLRGRFGAWKERGLAEWRGPVRFYRRAVLEHRGNVEAMKARGERAARRAS